VALVVVVVAALSATGVVTWLVEHHTVDTRDYPHSEVTAVQLFAPSAQVRIFAGQDGQAAVTEDLRWVVAKPVVTQQYDPRTGTLTVSASCDGLKFLGGDGGGCDVELDIEVPATASVHAVTDSGSTTVSALTGNVDVQTASGDIELNGLAGPILARAAGGSIDATSLLSDQVSAQAWSGSVQLDFARPPSRVSARVTVGVVNIQVPRGSRYRVTAATSSGGRSVDPGLPSPTASGTILATATSGAVNIGYR
jgi:hypothetical protein